MENTITENINNCVVFEGMTTISALISALDSNKECRKIIKIMFDKEKTSSKSRELSFLKIKSKQHGFELSVVSKDELNALASGTTHGGIIAICSDREVPQ